MFKIDISAVEYVYNWCKCSRIHLKLIYLQSYMFKIDVSAVEYV